MLLQASLVTGALLAISGCCDFPVSAARPTLNMLPRFYKANPATAEQPAVYKTIDACYLLVDWNDFASTQIKYLKKGYVLLGHCGFAEELGMPLLDNAIEYGRYLGADVIIYAVRKTVEGQTEHRISYLVKSAFRASESISGLPFRPLCGKTPGADQGVIDPPGSEGSATFDKPGGFSFSPPLDVFELREETRRLQHVCTLLR